MATKKSKTKSFLSNQKSINFYSATLIIASLIIVGVSYKLYSSASAGGFQSSLTLNQADPRLGQSVNFTAVLNKTLKNPVLIVDCFQNQVLVYEQRGSTNDTFLLGGTSSLWLNSGGQASCTANVYNLVYKNGQVNYMVQAVTQFTAAGL